MVSSNWCDYSGAYITIPNTAAAGATANNVNKKVILKKKLCFIY